ncbi:MAG: hypothetical protein AAB316_13980 [Bacteroidota bacterium]
MSCSHFKEHHPTCSECNRNAIFIASEKKSKYVLNNPLKREACKIRVDGCAIANIEVNKCDYLFLSCDTSISFFVELKGKDLSHAIDQLDRSIDHFLPVLGGFAVNARAVLSRVQTPDLRTAKYLHFRKKLHRLGGTFTHKNKLIEDTLA